MFLWFPMCPSGGSSERGGTRRRAGRGAREGAAGGDTKEDTSQICVEGVGEVQSDLNPQDPLQKVVRFSPDLSLLLVGGTDGHIRVWEVRWGGGGGGGGVEGPRYKSVLQKSPL